MFCCAHCILALVNSCPILNRTVVPLRIYVYAAKPHATVAAATQTVGTNVRRGRFAQKTDEWVWYGHRHDAHLSSTVSSWRLLYGSSACRSLFLFFYFLLFVSSFFLFRSCLFISFFFFWLLHVLCIWCISAQFSLLFSCLEV